jgi:hypothetical protein
LEEFFNETITVITGNSNKTFQKVKCAVRTAYAYAPTYSHPKTNGIGKREGKLTNS